MRHSLQFWVLCVYVVHWFYAGSCIWIGYWCHSIVINSGTWRMRNRTFIQIKWMIWFHHHDSSEYFLFGQVRFDYLSQPVATGSLWSPLAFHSYVKIYVKMTDRPHYVSISHTESWEKNVCFRFDFYCKSRWASRHIYSFRPLFTLFQPVYCISVCARASFHFRISNVLNYEAPSCLMCLSHIYREIKNEQPMKRLFQRDHHWAISTKNAWFENRWCWLVFVHTNMCFVSTFRHVVYIKIVE